VGFKRLSKTRGYLKHHLRQIIASSDVTTALPVFLPNKLVVLRPFDFALSIIQYET